MPGADSNTEPPCRSHKDNRAKYRFFCDSLELRQGPFDIELADGEAHHALHVLRLARGQKVELFNGCGLLAKGVIERTSRRNCCIAVDNVTEIPASARPAIHIASALPKAKRQDWLLEKLTELSISSFTPLLCNRSSVQTLPDRNYMARWQKICISAARQSGCNYLPILNQQIKPADIFKSYIANDRHRLIMAHCGRDTVPLAGLIAPDITEFTLLIGPEGGWSDEELVAAKAAGVETAILGNTIMRIETAAIAMTAALRALCP